MKKALLVILLLLPVTLPRAQNCVSSSNCESSCSPEPPYFCKGYSCLTSDERCLVKVGMCSSGETCAIRTCIDKSGCPPNPNRAQAVTFDVEPVGVAPFTIIYSSVTVSLEGWNRPTYSTDNWKRFTSALWLATSPSCHRREIYLGFTCYVHRLVLSDGLIIERWYAPTCGPVWLKETVKGAGWDASVEAVAIAWLADVAINRD